MIRSNGDVSVELVGRVGDDCYSAWVVWNRLPDCKEFEGRTHYKAPLDLRKDGLSAVYRDRPVKPVLLWEV